ncbi:hypothetical protein ACLQ2I_00175, partial [Streptomyces sp. DT117]
MPARFGGLEFSVPQQIDLLLEIARGCGSTGWVCEGRITGAWVIRLFPDQAREEVYAGGTARVSGGFTPSVGTLVPTEGDYLLDGTWHFTTGCHGADWNLTATNLLHHLAGPGRTPAHPDPGSRRRPRAARRPGRPPTAPRRRRTEPAPPHERAELRGQGGYAVQLAKEATHTLFTASGASAIQRSLPTQRFFYDVQGISTHAMMTPDANLEVYPHPPHGPRGRAAAEEEGVSGAGGGPPPPPPPTAAGPAPAP